MPGDGYERQNCTATSVPNAPSSAERREPASKRHADLSDLTRTGNTGPRPAFVLTAANGNFEPILTDAANCTNVGNGRHKAFATLCAEDRTMHDDLGVSRSIDMVD